MIDGEIIIATDRGLDFEALHQRIHPADSRVRMLAEKTPASVIAFDLHALGNDDYTGRPFSERRAALVGALAGSGPPSRHTVQFNRWRPDRDPRSCTYAQLEQPLTFRLADIVPGLGPSVS